MARASLQIVIVLVLLNASAGVITASGLGDALSINPEFGGTSEQVDEVTSSVDDVQPSQGTFDTLFNLFTSTASTMRDVYIFVFYGPVMLANLGIPTFITNFLSAAAGIIVAADLIHVLTGRDP